MLVVIAVVVINNNLNVAEAAPGGFNNFVSDGDGTPNANGCSSCKFTYVAEGIRLTLYQYDGKKLQAKAKSIDMIQDDPDVSSLNAVNTAGAYLTKDRRGKLDYTVNGYSPQMTRTRTRNFAIKLTNRFSCLFGSGCTETNFRKSVLKRYFAASVDSAGNVTKSKSSVQIQQELKKDFGYTISLEDFDTYYLVIEPTAAVQPRGSGTAYHYGTIYELLKNYTSYSGITKYMNVHWPNALYTAYGANKKSDIYNFVGNSGKYLLRVEGRSSPNAGSQIRSDPRSGYGISVYWLKEYQQSCKDVCTGKKGDALLQCAENYCAQQEDVKNSSSKRNCITSKDKCNYKEEPFACSSSGSTSNFKDTACGADASSVKKECTVNSVAQVSNRAAYQYMKNCTTNTTISYPDITKSYKPGTGFSYDITKAGDKKCELTFNYKKWKLDYAAAYTNTERSNLLRAITDFNSRAWENVDEFRYNSSTIENSTVTFKEKVGNKTISTTRKIELVEKNITGDGDKVQKDSYRGGTVNSWYSYKSGSKYVQRLVGSNYQRFILTSTNSSLFGLDKICVSRSESGKTYSPSTSGKCNAGDSAPERKYYTNFNASEKSTHSSIVTMHDKGATNKESTNTCEYETRGEFTCSIDVTPGPDSNGHYYNPRNLVSGTHLRFTLNLGGKDSDLIKKYGIGEVEYNGNNANTVLNGRKVFDKRYSDLSTKYKTGGIYNVYGYVQGSSGKIVPCPTKIEIDPCHDCPRCNIEVKRSGEKLTFSLEHNGKSITSYSGTSVTNYGLRVEPSKTWRNVDKLTVDWKDARRTQYQDGTVKSSLVVRGLVKVNGVELTCYKKVDDLNSVDDTDNRTCTKLYKPLEKEKIETYCNKNWSVDTANYQSSDDCIQSCSAACKGISDPSNYSQVDRYCDTGYIKDGFASKSDCINYCSRGNSKTVSTISNEYYYRPVSITDPFPGNDFKLITGATGRRPGDNWLARDDYISIDANDRTSLQTGQPEFVIELDAQTIKEIRNQTSHWNSTHRNTNAYISYIRANGNQSGEYKSKFIHDSDINGGGFAKYFTVVNGTNVK